ncbi:hypothetical protein [Paenibacillus tyrfis]|uniref:Uncharacterized protein n=1 Tax=Paenibacillus tyrfis TaxID=1501230 RepID=A0A081PAR3_9BACL|nr:hypothetical protein [Paenibacillus tyrfis]KEQ27786.1 hypothetical protein ET33_14025 [Paenibacillus tyrfis]
MSTTEMLIQVGGILLNGVLTYFVIRISRQTAESNKRSAKAAEESALASQKSYELNQQIIMLEIQKEKTKKEAYRKYYSKKIINYAQVCWNALLDGYRIGDVRDKSRLYRLLKEIDYQPPFTEEDLIPYFEYEEIEPIIQTVSKFKEFLLLHIKPLGDPDHTYDGALEAEIMASSLIEDFERLMRTDYTKAP